VQVLFATEKLLVNAEGNVRPQIESAVRAAGYQLRDENAPRAEEPPRGCARICRSSPSSP
jgi:Cd2+/Zn2+-exporting ATPase